MGWTNALRESFEVEFVGIFEPDPETIAVRSQDPAYGGVRWLSEDELPGDRSVQAVFVETRLDAWESCIPTLIFEKAVESMRSGRPVSLFVVEEFYLPGGKLPPSIENFGDG